MLAGSGRGDPLGLVEGVLRHDAPVQLTSRWCRDTTPVAGVTLEPYGQVLILLGAGNRDPQRYRDPAVFGPTRPSIQPLSFGAGPHFCVGAALARMEGLADRLRPAHPPVTR